MFEVNSVIRCSRYLLTSTEAQNFNVLNTPFDVSRNSPVISIGSFFCRRMGGGQFVNLL